MTNYILKLRAGQFKVPVVFEPKGNRIFLSFPFNRALLNEIKVMKGARWHGFEDPPIKKWSIANCKRNDFQLVRLHGGSPYEFYDRDWIDVTPNRKCLYEHQIDMIRFCLTRKKCMLAAEMGTGKTLAAIEIMEHSHIIDWTWVGPSSALAAVELEFRKWAAIIQPKFMTYERLRKEVQEQTFIPSEGIIFDESSKVKNPTAQRSQAALIATEEIRKLTKDSCYIILMSGAPAPKSPVDWWHQCEMACPGFLREGEYKFFRQRLALIVKKESISGGVYPELVAWYDDEKKCKICGHSEEDHAASMMEELEKAHTFEPSVNEVANLYKRMSGLVLVRRKKDCLDLPEMQYRLINIEATKSVQRAERLIVASTPRTVTALILLRELSDGFQYTKEKGGDKLCERCKGAGTVTEYSDEGEEEHGVSCYRCKGTGREEKTVRGVKEVPCPKDQVLIDVLDEHEPIGRLVVYAAFEASVDRCVRIALQYQWDVIRVDGRGWCYHSFKTGKTEALNKVDMLEKFQNKNNNKIVFVGQPGAAGMGLTLTASPSILNFSSTYNNDDRIQSTNRIHRIGMDVNLGATVIDIIHLKTDQYILDNLEEKTDLLNLTMGDLQQALKETDDVNV